MKLCKTVLVTDFRWQILNYLQITRASQSSVYKQAPNRQQTINEQRVEEEWTKGGEWMAKTEGRSQEAVQAQASRLSPHSLNRIA